MIPAIIGGVVAITTGILSTVKAKKESEALQAKSASDYQQALLGLKTQATQAKLEENLADEKEQRLYVIIGGIAFLIITVAVVIIVIRKRKKK